ncbi:hypothetical protein HPB47_008860 [Ixodes persulcatus]|uniref:Uncharacterized protein n=1 Tax=Ixodes persulcatus TaxID=34615 RepID=A0AC60P3K0_IXOPE|nr:hypothetical protein HPB47_008860 [Ixodes persulcatus]
MDSALSKLSKKDVPYAKMVPLQKDSDKSEFVQAQDERWVTPADHGGQRSIPRYASRPLLGASLVRRGRSETEPRRKQRPLGPRAPAAAEEAAEGPRAQGSSVRGSFDATRVRAPAALVRAVVAFRRFRSALEEMETPRLGMWFLGAAYSFVAWDLASNVCFRCFRVSRQRSSSR